jgi:tetrahydromethanopterin S-methyltransferase subunit F
MTDTSHTRTTTGSSPSYTTSANDVSGWAGWVVFAGIMMIMLGAFQAIEGLVALFDDGYYLVTASGLVLNVNYNVWGWTHLILGILAVATGFGLLAGNTAARVVGIIIAVVSAIVNLAFIAAYPVWSTIVIAVDIIAIYAIVVHGRELKRDAS